MIKTETRIVVYLPSQQVFAYISDFENNLYWQSGMVECKFTSPSRFGLGATYTQVAKFLGRQVRSTFEVVGYEAGHLVKAASTSGSFPITITRIVEPGEGGCIVTAIVEGDSSGYFKLAEPVMARLVQRSMEADYARLKLLLEEGELAGGRGRA